MDRETNPVSVATEMVDYVTHNFGACQIVGLRTGDNSEGIALVAMSLPLKHLEKLLNTLEASIHAIVEGVGGETLEEERIGPFEQLTSMSAQTSELGQPILSMAELEELLAEQNLRYTLFGTEPCSQCMADLDDGFDVQVPWTSLLHSHHDDDLEFSFGARVSGQERGDFELYCFLADAHSRLQRLIQARDAGYLLFARPKHPGSSELGLVLHHADRLPENTKLHD
jgi:hypothetical protein